MAGNKVEICGVDTSTLPTLSHERMRALLEKAQAGEEVDLEGFANALKEKFPDYADMIDMYVMLFQTYGVEGLASMVSPAE